MPETLIIILGPTASGKTSLGIQVAQWLKTEIISADSRQFYKELFIGTARPSSEEMQGVPHHFTGHLSIRDYYNASKFETEVLALLGKLFLQHQNVLLVGGSGLYINAVCYGIDDLPATNNEIRDSLRKKYEAEGIESLRQQLKLLDPEYYKKVDLRNPNRILKAIEISTITGKPYSSLLTATKKERPFKILKIGLNPPRDLLYENINNRVDRMVEQGLVEEARSVFSLKELNALNTVGYKELFDAFEGKISLDEAIDLIKRHTRKFARKQLTWFRKDNDIHWFDPADYHKIIKFIRLEINSFKQ